MMRRVWLAPVVFGFACGEVHNNPNPDGGMGSGDGGSGVCEASKALRCESNTLISCNADGTAETQTACALRCDATALTCENKVDPSNGFAAQLDAATGQPALNITQSTLINTVTTFDATAGTFTIGSQTFKASLVPGTNGSPDVLVVSVGSVNIVAGATLSILDADTYRRAFAIMSAGDVTIAGTIDARSGRNEGNSPCAGAPTTAAGADGDNPGGGGGGFGTAGANGGAVLLVAQGGLGGQATGGDTMVPLRGGCAGGMNPFGGGGYGGGALQITSATRIDVTGKIGAGGAGGVASTGGGSGGGLLLEAPVVALSGGVYANGGGGGCGDFGNSGADGQMSVAPAPGCTLSNVSGGSGGAGTTPPTNGGGVSNTTGTNYAGGGGGAVGRIRINTLDHTVTGSGQQSPPASLGTVAGR